MWPSTTLKMLGVRVNKEITRQEMQMNRSLPFSHEVHYRNSTMIRLHFRYLESSLEIPNQCDLGSYHCRRNIKAYAVFLNSRNSYWNSFNMDDIFASISLMLKAPLWEEWEWEWEWSFLNGKQQEVMFIRLWEAPLTQHSLHRSLPHHLWPSLCFRYRDTRWLSPQKPSTRNVKSMEQTHS